MHARSLIPAGLLVCTVAAGCSRSTQHAELAQPQAAPEATAVQPPAPAVEPWPEGYVVFEETRWLPVALDFDRNIYAARQAFAKGDHASAKAELDHAVAWLKQAGSRSGEHSADYDRAIKALEGLEGQLSHEPSQLTAQTFDQTLRGAYPSDLYGYWAETDALEVLPYVEQPAAHFEKARALLARNDASDAAFEVQRGADWVDLLADSPMKEDDRALFRQVATQLRAAAEDIRAKRPNGQHELDEALAAGDEAYELYYLHWAEREHRAQKLAELEHPLRSLAERIESRAQLAGRKLDTAELRLTKHLRSASDRAKDGGKLLERELKHLFEDAHHVLDKQHDRT